MIYKELGNTGINVSTIALGCEGFVDKTAEAVKRDFDYAISEGINFVDIYSSNPDVRKNIGSALKGRRENFVIQSHLCTTWENEQYLRTRDIEKVKASFELMLQQLDTDYIDIGMIHYIDNERDFHIVFDGPIIKYAQQLKQEGRIKHIGMSSHNPVVAKMAVETGLIEVLMFSINPCYDMQPPGEDVESLWADESYEHALQNIDPDRESLYELCESKGVGVDVMKVYGGGDLLSESNSPFGKALTPAQCIEYALTRPAVAAVMVGCHNIDEMKQALYWCDASEEEKDYSTALTGLTKFTWKGHCMYCGHCAPCSVGIDIANVNKFYNLTEAQGFIPETVADHYKLLKHHASECIKCDKCEKNCPFGVSIIEGMAKAAERFGY
jgi:predicted aldo/keto reductase-like oxidoreductase